MTQIKTRKIAYYAGMVALPAAIGALVGKTKRSALAGSVAGGLTAVAMLGLRWQLARFFTEQPAYEIEERIGQLEIRRYHPTVMARTRVESNDYDRSLQTGFKKLAGYIFGDNFNGEKLPMTSPVQTRSNDAFVMSFVMPQGRSLETLPRPNDIEVELEEVPERRVAVLRFSGRYRGTDVHLHEHALMRMVKRAGLQPMSAPMFAGFDSPATIPFLRRNEVWVEVAPHS
ncbi:MAG TPA: heme-binding protein [Kofleriaceae bacterium]